MKALLFGVLALAAAAAAAQAPDVSFVPHPGAPVSGALEFREGRLAQYLGARPVVLVLGYLGCVNLCGTTLTGVSEALRDSGLAAERDYTALFVSIDPRDERAPLARRAGWHFLTGAAPAAAVARAVGFRYSYEEASGQFAHPAGFVLLTPAGTVARYFEGVRFDARELRRAIRAAASGAPPAPFERLLLVCFHDPVNGRYTQAVLLSLRAAALLFLAALAFAAWRRLR